MLNKPRSDQRGRWGKGRKIGKREAGKQKKAWTSRTTNSAILTVKADVRRDE